jgi:lysophospholipase L1-like esterase
MRKLLTIFLGTVVGLTLTAGPSGAATPALPNSMAAIGDSITQAFDACCWYGNHPANSWSTGWAGWDGVRSHYERILAHKPAISGHNYNDAVSGARMSDAPGQAALAVSQGAKYVTILMGANDVCTSSRSTAHPWSPACLAGFSFTCTWSAACPSLPFSLSVEWIAMPTRTPRATAPRAISRGLPWAMLCVLFGPFFTAPAAWPLPPFMVSAAWPVP